MGSTKIDAHGSGCHRWHSCSSGQGTYVCGDLGYCNYCPDNQYCKAGKPTTAAKQKTPEKPLAVVALTGRVVKVADGDRITVLDNTSTQHRIQLQGFDAPEKGQPYGNASRKHLATLVAGKPVTVKRDKRGRDGRIMAGV
ncbi:MAG: thermonuclease family protein [Acidiferrobacterales bacterium]